MRSVTRILLVSLLCLGFVSSKAEAIPVLQLDLAGGVYDEATETIVAPGGAFELFAILTPNGGTDLATLLATTYYISVALTPAVDEPGDLGSFEFDGSTHNATSGLVYGNPPMEYIETILHDGGDLPPHGIFPTYFMEIAFTFSAANQIAEYNTQDNPGGPSAGTGAYYASFLGDSSLLSSGYNLHFDLYDVIIRECGTQRNCTAGDIDVDRFAPFSHDAETTTRVPEPSSAILLLLGSTLAAGFRSRITRKQKAA